jgi:electron transport complex protein RnfC
MSLADIFRHSKGVHPPENKVTADRKVEKMPLPKVVYLPVAQHIGAPAKVIVKRGEEVKTGQVIAEAGGYVSAPIHSTVSGKVAKITQGIHFVSGRPMDIVVIESDGNDDWVELEKISTLSGLSNDDILKRIWDAGLVGMGGATFPTHVKLKPPEDKPIDTLIINGAECEPWITSDNRVMLEQGEKVLKGLKVMMKLIPVKRAILAIEKNKPEAIAHMTKLVAKSRMKKVEVLGLPVQYPMGGEKTMTKEILNREVPILGLPLDIGVVVQNVSTCVAISDAVYGGKPLVERVMTVTGLVRKPRNLRVRFGTPVGDLVEHCGGIKEGADEIIFGGPMMGITQYTLDTPVQKGTNCVLIKKNTKAEERNCIRCSNCVNTCPMELMPTMFVAYAKKKMWEEAGEVFIDDCMECGSCAYACPASIPIVQYIKLAKAELGKIRRAKG